MDAVRRVRITEGMNQREAKKDRIEALKKIKQKMVSAKDKPNELQALRLLYFKVQRNKNVSSFYEYVPDTLPNRRVRKL